MKNTARIIITLAAAAALALPGAAFAREGESGGGSTKTSILPQREIEAVDTTEAVENEPTEAGEPTRKAAADDAADTTEDPFGDPAGDDNDASADETPILPELAPAFLRRTWRMGASVDNFDAGVLSATVDRVLKLPRSMRAVRSALSEFDAAILVGDRTRVSGKRGRRLGKAAVAAALDGADQVVVTGKVLAPKSWRTDEDGTPLLTVRAKRIQIKR